MVIVAFVIVAIPLAVIFVVVAIGNATVALVIVYIQWPWLLLSFSLLRLCHCCCCQCCCSPGHWPVFKCLLVNQNSQSYQWLYVNMSHISGGDARISVTSSAMTSIIALPTALIMILILWYYDNSLGYYSNTSILNPRTIVVNLGLIIPTRTPYTNMDPYTNLDSLSDYIYTNMDGVTPTVTKWWIPTTVGHVWCRSVMSYTAVQRSETYSVLCTCGEILWANPTTWLAEPGSGISPQVRSRPNQSGWAANET